MPKSWHANRVDYFIFRFSSNQKPFLVFVLWNLAIFYFFYFPWLLDCLLMSILINLLGTGLIISFIEISSFIITQFRVFFPTNHIFLPFDILFIISFLFPRLIFTKNIYHLSVTYFSSHLWLFGFLSLSMFFFILLFVFWSLSILFLYILFSSDVFLWFPDIILDIYSDLPWICVCLIAFYVYFSFAFFLPSSQHPFFFLSFSLHLF